MITTSQGRETCRIVVGFKSTLDIDLSIRAATVLAAAVEAEVVGLFVLEQAMIDLAGLPFARALSYGGSQPEQLSSDSMMQAFNRGALCCRRALSQHAEAARVKWSFSQERGELPATVEAAVATGDFVVLSGERHGIGVNQLIDQLRTLPPGPRGVMVTLPVRATPVRGPVIAISEGDRADEEVVELAANIASVTDQPLILFVIADTSVEADEIAQRAQELAGSNVLVAAHHFIPGAQNSIATGFAHLSPSFVVASGKSQAFGDDDAAVILLRAANAPVLLMSPSTGNDS